MSIGKIFFALVFIIVVFVGIYIALNQTSKGVIQVDQNGGGKFVNSLLWFLPKRIASSSLQDAKNREIGFGEANIIEKGSSSQVSGKIEKKSEIVPPAGYSQQDLSPFYKQIRIAQLTPVNRSNYSSSNGFKLSADSKNKESIFISGWYLAGNNKTQVYVPRGIADYLPNGNFSDNAISLAPGGYAIFYNTQSPIKKNFRLNLCTGYFNEAYGFSPSLPENCPLPYDRGEVISSSGACQSFLFSLSRCETVSPADRNRFYGQNDNACRNALDRFTYGYCYEKNRARADFFSKEWRVWLGIPMPFEPKHDHVFLYDNAGLIVDEYIY